MWTRIDCRQLVRIGRAAATTGLNSGVYKDAVTPVVINRLPVHGARQLAEPVAATAR